MLLSELLKKHGFSGYRIINERPFSCLAITAQRPQLSTCTFLDSEKYIRELSDDVTMLFTTEELSSKFDTASFGLCITDDPRTLFFLLHNALADDPEYVRPRFKTKIGKNCNISPLAVISDHNVIIGDNVTIEEFVVIRDNVTIGDNSSVYSGAVIGRSGFEIKHMGDVSFSTNHCGGTVIGKNVVIQNLCIIDKALYPWDNTVIGDYCVLDGMVKVAHGCKLGRCVLVSGRTGIAGRAVVGDGSWVGPGCCIRNGITVGKNCRVNMCSAVTKDVPDGAEVSGNFAIDHKKFIRNMKEANRD